MKLTTVTNVSVDGVMQGLGGADEDRRGGFTRGGWAMPHYSGEVKASMESIYGRADAFLFGRRTYETFAGSWGAMEDMVSQPIGRALNARPKYVVSATLNDPAWEKTTVLSGDLVAAVQELKAEPGGELQVPGSGELVRWLLEHDLVDEMALFIHPLVIGQGTRLFPHDGHDHTLALAQSQTTPNGVTIAVYRPGGRIQETTSPR